MERRDAVVIGAGPAGLAAAGCLRREGLRPLVLEQGEIARAWRTRYDRLRLHTIRSLSGLPGRQIPRRCGRYVARDDLVAYLESCAAELEVRTHVRAERIDEGWIVRTAAGGVEAGAVVVATGYCNVPYVPAWPGRELFRGELLHSADYRNPAPYAGREVLVVGIGNSGAEIAAELAGGGASVRLAVRTPPSIVRRESFGVPGQLLGLVTCGLPPRAIDPVARAMRRLSVPDLAPHGLPAPRRPLERYRRTGTVPVVDVGLVDALVAGSVEIVASVESLDETGVLLADGARLEPDVVLAATGFRPGLEPLVGHLGVLDAHGVPRFVDAEPAAPGLFFLGFRPALGGMLRQIGRRAPHVARAVAQLESTL